MSERAKKSVWDVAAEYMQRITDCQCELYAYICALMGGSAHAHDVLQEANLVLLHKADEYDRSRPFAPWARKIAYFQVLAYRKKMARDRLVFNEAVLQAVAAHFDREGPRMSDRLNALNRCIQELPCQQRELVRRRYQQGQTVDAIAGAAGKSPNAVSAALYRIRLALLRCIEGTLATGGAS